MKVAFFSSRIVHILAAHDYSVNYFDVINEWHTFCFNLRQNAYVWRQTGHRIQLNIVPGNLQLYLAHVLHVQYSNIFPLPRLRRLLWNSGEILPTSRVIAPTRERRSVAMIGSIANGPRQVQEQYKVALGAQA